MFLLCDLSSHTHITHRIQWWEVFQFPPLDSLIQQSWFINFTQTQSLETHISFSICFCLSFPNSAWPRIRTYLHFPTINLYYSDSSNCARFPSILVTSPYLRGTQLTSQHSMRAMTHCCLLLESLGLPFPSAPHQGRGCVSRSHSVWQSLFFFFLLR